MRSATHFVLGARLIPALMLVIVPAAEASFNQTVSGDGSPWHGTAAEQAGYIGVLSGLAFHNGSAGFTVLGTFAGRILEHGFVPDINNEVFLEGQIGPLFISNDTALMSGVHLRWDFEMDKMWRLYALGGVGDVLTPVSMQRNLYVYPRFGVGVLWSLAPNVKFRGELSHEVVAVGVAVGM